jgi:hypothetical protein
VRQGATEPCCGVGGPQFWRGVGEATGRHLASLMLLTLDRQRLSATVQPPPGEPSQGFPGDEGALTWGADEWTVEPLAPLESVKSLVLLCHANCVTISREWRTMPPTR